MEQKFWLADAHCDTATVLTPWRLAFGGNTQLDFQRLAGRGKLQFMAFFMGAQAEKLSKTEVWRKLRQHWLDLRYAAALCGDVELLEDLRQAGGSTKTQIVPALEGLDWLGGDWRAVDELYAWGFRSFGLFWNDDSFLGCGAAANRTPEADTGLSAAGRELVAHLAGLGRLVDLAHASDNSFWQAADLLAAEGRPLFVSHACCRALCEHPRNLTDEQLRAVGQSGGLVGITLVPQFLSADGAATPADFARHAAHAAALAGVESVCLGSDFDGTAELPLGVEGVQDAAALYDSLLAEGFAEAEARLIMGENLANFLRKY
ncbi:MAG: membrane dipeptidase [Firmicutes bacterium]|nr:membrane dipeptidase [Bacillota bacterium]